MSAATLRPARSGRFAAVLDAGSFKTVCLIATLDSEGRPARIAGVGLAPSLGIKFGVVVDLAAAEGAIRFAIAQAENMAGIRLERIDLLLNGGPLASRTFAAAAPVENGTVTQQTVDRVAAAGRAHATKDGRQILQLDTWGYSLDGSPLVADPVGTRADRIAAHHFVVTADAQPVANLTRTIGRCYLAAHRLVPGPIASALAVTSEDERRHGIVTIDIGAAVTGVAMFQDGRAIFARTLPIGGGHVTLDIVHALRTPLEEAERIKTLYGTVLKAQSDQHDVFTYAITGVGEGLEQRSTKADLARIIQSRMAQLLHLVRDQLASAGLLDETAARIVLCGGGSEISGLQSFAEGVFRRPVREGRPQTISGLPPLYASAAFAGAVGVLRAVAESAADDLPGALGLDAPGGYMSRVGQWLKDGF
jgi:cell division protein FtsA